MAWRNFTTANRSFNEAGAIKPRKTRDAVDEAIAEGSFNEAGAIKPRKTSGVIWMLSSRT